MTHKRKMMIGALLLILGTLAALVIWQFEKPGSLVWENGFQYQMQQTMMGKTYTHDLPADASKITALEINVKDTAVKVIQGDKFEVTTHSLSSKNSSKVSFDQGRLTVQDSGSEHTILNFGLGFVTNPTQMIIRIPKTQDLVTLVVKSRNGELEFDHIASQTAEITAGNGEMTFEHSEFDTLRATSVNGDIQLKQTEIAHGGKITNQNGDIAIKASRLPAFYAKTRWGDKELDTPHQLSQTSQSEAKLIIINQNGDLEIE
ncbi:DUF4097 family beta strand repeat-containing protein [Pseudolactococcus reticulitermitis]|uniref:DUF4097 domain-containing protein n=1 Tax=Pseudolactococcus reticulitermitis TaxID=2025039 RepID=A0A224WW14_9LACT|nr:DUF4097 family beta strand repeat-containing protein [Lactococcus reticulitermitis]GAX46548.1 hypothetical protein RsY01_127 [Lactococcus reticulitermitis]